MAAHYTARIVEAGLLEQASNVCHTLLLLIGERLGHVSRASQTSVSGRRCWTRNFARRRSHHRVLRDKAGTTIGHAAIHEALTISIWTHNAAHAAGGIVRGSLVINALDAADLSH